MKLFLILSLRKEKEKNPSQLTVGHFTSMQIISSGICGSDHHVLTGSSPMNFPLIPGHEGAGIVESIGEGVSSVKPGKRNQEVKNIFTNILPKSYLWITELKMY